MNKGRFFRVADPIKIFPSNTMFLEVYRYSSGDDSTLGLLIDITDNREFVCFTLEDEARAVKIAGETRIPAGSYDVKLRTTGGFNSRYLKKYGSNFHKGMLWLQDVPGFEYILIHSGNSDDDTAGCLLVGDSAFQNITQNGYTGSSVDAYKRVYPKMAYHLLGGGTINITYIDADG